MSAGVLEQLFDRPKPLIGMVHLLPLPGSPRYDGNFSGIIERALRDAEVLAEANFDGLLVENYGDVPFYPKRVPSETVAGMTRVVTEIVRHFDLPIGVNVLRNDAESALAVALVSGAKFIRVNVLVGVTTSDQGFLAGQAHRVQRDRVRLGAECFIFADVAVKHAYPLVEVSLEDQVADCIERGLADGLIASGPRTGSGPDMEHLREAKKLASRSGVPLLIGSGVSRDNLIELLGVADGAIIGTSIKRGSETIAPVDHTKAMELVALAEKLRGF